MTHTPIGADPYVIQYTVDGTTWKHGRTVEAWVVADKLALSAQRRYTIENAREWEIAGIGDRVRTRVLAEQEGWDAIS